MTRKNIFKQLWLISGLTVTALSAIAFAGLLVLEKENFSMHHSSYPNGLETSIFISLFYFILQGLANLLYYIPRNIVDFKNYLALIAIIILCTFSYIELIYIGKIIIFVFIPLILINLIIAIIMDKKEESIQPVMR